MNLAYQIHDDRRVNATMRDNRLADARRERDDALAVAALLRSLLEGNIEGWTDFGGGEIRLYAETHLCDCYTRFVTEDDEGEEAPAWMTAQWLRNVQAAEEVKTTEGVVTTEVCACAKCAGDYR